MAIIERALARNIQQAPILLMVSDIMNWNLDREIKEAIESQLSEDVNELEKSILVDFYNKKMAKLEASRLADGESCLLEVAAGVVKQYVNDVLNERKRKMLNTNQWGAFLRECGFQDGVNKRKMSKRKGKHLLIFDSTVLEKLDIVQASKSEDNTKFLLNMIATNHPTKEKVEQCWSDLKPHLAGLIERGWVGVQANEELYVVKRG